MTATARNRKAAAFTLVELMVSIALVLIIILGVNAVFKMASDTVNGGQALAAANRENRSIQSVIYGDFENAAITDGPMLLIRSERVPAFRNREDELADRDFDPQAGPAQQMVAMMTMDLDNNNQEGEAGVPGERIPALVYNSRNHRIDRIGFFANHLYRRQTGTQNATVRNYLDPGTSSEAYVWYGHLKQPDFTSARDALGHYTHRDPNEPNVRKDQKITNYYATDWILGRCVTLLQEHVPPGQNYVGTDRTTINRFTTPLTPSTKVRTPNGTETDAMFGWSYCDLADTSINEYRGRLSTFHSSWLQPGGPPQPWWERLGDQRFEGYPYPDRPLTAEGLARTVPVFVQGCTQFIIEYAGDFLAQDPLNGDVVGTFVPSPGGSGPRQGTDGQIDYLVVREVTPAGSGLPPVRNIRRVRWYGMPRDTDAANGTAIPGTGNVRTMRDVVPLRDVLEAAGATVPTTGFIEEFNADLAAPKANYGDAGAFPPGSNPIYYAKWGPSELSRGSGTPRPKMLRITLVVDDPNGRMGEGQQYEYVINLP